MSELYMPVGTHGTILRPYQGSWSVHPWTTKLPAIIDPKTIIFRASDLPEDSRVLGSTFRHYAKLGYLGFQLPDRTVFLVKESDVGLTLPDKFDELYDQAEQELEAAAHEAAYSPFR